jgi:hypothetical protein
MKGLRLAAVLALGCSAESEPIDFSCDPVTQRVGLYLQEVTPISGNCGPQSASLVQVDSGIPDTCVRVEPDEWRDDSCTLVRWTRCQTGSGTSELLAITTQQDPAGDVVSGTMTLRIRTSDGDCDGTANVKWTRQ